MKAKPTMSREEKVWRFIFRRESRLLRVLRAVAKRKILIRAIQVAAAIFLMGLPNARRLMRLFAESCRDASESLSRGNEEAR